MNKKWLKRLRRQTPIVMLRDIIDILLTRDEEREGVLLDNVSELNTYWEESIRPLIAPKYVLKLIGSEFKKEFFSQRQVMNHIASLLGVDDTLRIDGKDIYITEGERERYHFTLEKI